MGAAVFAGSMFQFGGIAGSLIVAFYAQRLGLGRIMAGAYVIAALSIALVAGSHDGSLVTMLAVAGAGIGVIGGQCGANALAAAYYPTTIRSTGVGWAFGVGRVGSIVGPVVGGTLLAMKMPAQQLFLLCIVPILIAALASAIVQRRINRAPLA
jgi:AAHS family 4-hydroxybenzoate transporter-like MFS transporter